MTQLVLLESMDREPVAKPGALTAERRRLRAKLAALDAARPEPGLRQEGPEEVQLHKRVGLFWDVTGLAPMHLKR